MDTLTEASLEALETRAKLQVKVYRTVLRHKLIMMGNALLVAFAAAYALLLIWTVVMAAGLAQTLLPWGAEVIGVTTAQLLKYSAVGMVAFKLAAFLLFLCPGLGLRICGSAMKP